MKTKLLALISLIILTGSAFLSCKKDTAEDPNQPFISKMKAVTDSIIQNTHVPGIVALVVDHKKGIDWLYTDGYSDVPNKLPMDGSYTFRLASVTKTMTVTVLLQLVDEGKLSLNDKLSQYFPTWPKSDSITIKMLCNMTSGISNYVANQLFQQTKSSDPQKVWSPQELIDLGLTEFYFSPGSSWAYSNTNTYIIGLIIELLTGNTLESEITNRIIIPLNLSKTGFLTSGLTFPGPHGRGYCWGEYKENEDLTEYYDISMAWAAGSAYGTPRELLKYAEALVKGGLISDSLQKRRLNDMVKLNPTTGYGLGIFHRKSFYGHNGVAPGFTVSMYHSLVKDCTVIIYFNSAIEVEPDALFFRFMDILYGNDY
jgi:D-alanyl-D-alanine carboxypeptidase